MLASQPLLLLALLSVVGLPRTGTVSVTYRGAVDDGFGNCVAESWRSPCVRPARNMFPDPRCERSIGLGAWAVALLRALRVGRCCQQGLGPRTPSATKGEAACRHAVPRCRLLPLVAAAAALFAAALFKRERL